MFNKLFLLSTFFFLKEHVSHAQYTQSIPPDFVDRVISSGKAWKAMSYEKVQVSGSSTPTNRGSIIFKEGKVEIIDQNNKKTIVSYEITPGVVDPRMKTSDGKVYEIRFFNKPPIELMRLRCVESPNRLYYLEDVTYIH